MAGKIIVATDGSETGGRAVDLAAELSAKLERPLCIVHVLMYGRPTAEFEAMARVEGLVPPVMTGQMRGDVAAHSALSARFPTAEEEVAHAWAVSALGDDIVERAKARAEEVGAREVTSHVCAGDIADEILDVAEVERAEMIVLGRRGLGRVREMVLGSVSQKVLHHAGCTVVVVQ